MTQEAVRDGRTVLGIELGSTRIKACLVLTDDPSTVLAVGSHTWENRFEDRNWTYSLDDVWGGVQAAFADLLADARWRHGLRVEVIGAIGVSAMMHGYLAFDAAGDQLVPFRTWRNTSTRRAAAELTELLGVNIPLRWSIAHLHQALLDGESHVASLASITTLAGYVHRALTGNHVLGIGDASGMFPVDGRAGGYDHGLIARYDSVVAHQLPVDSVADLLPRVQRAGEWAGVLTTEGARLLDPTGGLQRGSFFCPPEGDAGTGMVATNSVAPRTGIVSAGTSVFAMAVLENPLRGVFEEVDLVATPAGDPVAMVHCNNGASELAAWVGLFDRFVAVAGGGLASDEVFEALFREALDGDPDAGGLLAYNHLAGEPIAGLTEGRPLFVRTPDSRFTLANFMRAQLYGVFGTLALGMRVLQREGVALDRMLAHGGVFRTAGVAQRFLAGALNVPISVGTTAAEGGAWGMAVLAAFSHRKCRGIAMDLSSFIDGRVFAGISLVTAEPNSADVAGFDTFLDRYSAGLALEESAVKAL